MSVVDVEHLRLGAADLHGRDPGRIDRPGVWWCEPERPAVVLGSRQHPELLDPAQCARSGLEIVRRRSGGGIVVLVPGEIVWIDILVPPGPAGNGPADDPRALMITVGNWWRSALVATCGAALGDDLEGDRLSVHAGPMMPSPWSELVCFAGLGPGEVLDGTRKLVGLSQRRGRWGARVQGLLHRRVDLAETAALLAVDGRAAPLPAAALPEVAVCADLGVETFLDHLVAQVAAASA